MKTLVPVKNLVSSLERLQTERPKFDEVCEELFAFNYEDFDSLEFDDKPSIIVTKSVTKLKKGLFALALK